MKFIRVAKVHDFDACRMRSFRILGRPVGVFRSEDGTLYAMAAGCKHQHADLTTGRIQGHIVTCPRHHWKYDLRTGHCTEGETGRLRRHGLKIEGDDVFITMYPLDEEEEGGQFDLDDEMDQKRQKDILTP